jgi:hypothetical protein
LRIAGGDVETQPGERGSDADDGGAVLGQHGPQRRVAVAGYGDPELLTDRQPRGEGSSAHLDHRPGQRGGLRGKGYEQYAESGRGCLNGALAAMQEGAQCLVEGEAAVGHEDADGCEHRPEEALLTVAEGVARVCPSRAPGDRGQEEHLVDAVGRRVRGLGEERS